MIRDQISKSMDHDPHFKWRGAEASRIESLSDIIFAIALGMVVSASEPLKTFGDLEGFLTSIIPVSAAFVILVSIWHWHFTFFRRYGITNTRIIFYNAVLLFTVLFIAYPLRFAFESLFSFVLMSTGNFDRVAALELTYERSGAILAYFAIGYAFVHGLFILMYRYAISKSEELDLTAKEMMLSLRSLLSFYIQCGLSILVAIIAWYTPANGMAGFIFFLSWPAEFWLSRKYDPEKIKD